MLQRGYELYVDSEQAWRPESQNYFSLSQLGLIPTSIAREMLSIISR